MKSLFFSLAMLLTMTMSISAQDLLGDLPQLTSPKNVKVTDVDHNNYGGVVFSIETCMLMETADSQEDSKAVVDMVHKLRDLVANVAEIQQLFNK